MRTASQLGWYRYLVHNRTFAGSLFTLLHLPFMLAFAFFVIIGVLPLAALDPTILALAVIAVVLVIYGEHLLDDTTGVGKPWDTVISDRALTILAAGMFIGALAIAWWSSILIGSPVPFVGIVAGISFSVLYGLEIWKFHTVAFGAVGMGAIPPFSYLAQTIAVHLSVAPYLVILLFIIGTGLAYVLLATYERTKVEKFYWNDLAVVFVLIYALGALSLHGISL